MLIKPAAIDFFANKEGVLQKYDSTINKKADKYL